MPEPTGLPLVAETPAPTVSVVTKPPKGRFELPPEPKAPEAPKPEALAAPTAASEAPEPAQNTEAQAPSAPEGETPKEEVTPEQAAKREGRRFERRLEKAFKRAAAAEAEKQLLEKQLNELRSAQPQAKEAPGKPKLEQFDYDPEKYAQAVADWTRKQTETELGEKQRTNAHKAERDRLVSAWEERVEQAQDKYEDWDTVVGTLEPDHPFTASIMEAENGPDVAHYLGKHPKEAERIAKLPPRLQVFEIGKLSAKLAATPEKPKTPSKAPAPITPITASTPVEANQPSENDGMRDWIRKRNKQLAARRG